MTSSISKNLALRMNSGTFFFWDLLLLPLIISWLYLNSLDSLGTQTVWAASLHPMKETYGRVDLTFYCDVCEFWSFKLSSSFVYSCCLNRFPRVVDTAWLSLGFVFTILALLPRLLLAIGSLRPTFHLFCYLCIEWYCFCITFSFIYPSLF